LGLAGFSLPESDLLIVELGFLSEIEIGVRALVGFEADVASATPFRPFNRRAEEADMD
jgi:hypothetical protein